ncbi:MAG: LysM peptidoglycan-binding domain-containing protein [Phycisphaerales bacterium]
MRKDPSDVTRELKLALIVGFALVLTVAILVSDHLSKARTATLATIGNTQKVVAKVPDAPIRSLDELPPSQLPAAIEVTAPVAAAPEATTPAPAETLASTTAPVVIGQQQAGTGHESKFGPGRTNGSLSASIREHADVSSVSPTLGSAMPTGATPQDIVQKEVKKTEGGKTPLAGEKTYKVADGDSLFAISKKFYNDGMLYKKLAAANKISESGGLKVGSTISIPSKESLTGKPEVIKPDAKLASKPATTTNPVSAKVEPKPDAKAVKVEASKAKSYQVRPGDTLTNIARLQLGSAARSTEIASLNKMDPDDDLLAGAILKLPSR